jgi:hypothetical protein
MLITSSIHSKHNQILTPELVSTILFQSVRKLAAFKRDDFPAENSPRKGGDEVCTSSYTPCSLIVCSSAFRRSGVPVATLVASKLPVPAFGSVPLVPDNFKNVF